MARPSEGQQGWWLCDPVAGATLADLIDRYLQDVPRTWGRSKAMSIELLRKELGDVYLSKLTANTLREWIDKRLKLGTGGVTVAMYLSALSTILQFGKHARPLNIDSNLAKEARAALAYRGINTRPAERSREPNADELDKLFAYWKDKGTRQKIPMETIVRLALATTMRLSEICGLRLEGIDRDNKTVIIRQRKHPTKKTQNDQLVPLPPKAWTNLAPLLEGPKKGRVLDATRSRLLQPLPVRLRHAESRTSTFTTAGTVPWASSSALAWTFKRCPC